MRGREKAAGGDAGEKRGEKECGKPTMWRIEAPICQSGQARRTLAGIYWFLFRYFLKWFGDGNKETRHIAILYVRVHL